MVVGKKIATRGQGCLEILFLPYGRGAILALLGLLLVHLSTKCKVSFCDHPASVIVVVVCPSVNNFLQMTSPTKPMDRFQNNFTGMVLRWSSFKVVQRIKFQVELWLLRHQKRGKLPNLKKSSCPKVLALFENYFAQKFLGHPLPGLFEYFPSVEKHGRQGAELVFLICALLKL